MMPYTIMGMTATAAFVSVMLASCMHAPSPARDIQEAQAPRSDSVTVALWHMDETGGYQVADSGPHHLDGTAGQETRTDFGRFRGARVFSSSIQSFVFVPYAPDLDQQRTMTIEAWVNVTAFGTYEDTPIAARWTEQPNEQSWLLGIVGQQLQPPLVSMPTPGYHQAWVRLGAVGHLVFAMQPEDASVPQVYFSSQPLELKHWTQIAVSFDGQAVRIYIDGRLDSQYATADRIRLSHAPLLIGNYFDPRWLRAFEGRLRAGSGVDSNPYYAFQGSIDELRMSSVARTDFPSARGR